MEKKLLKRLIALVLTGGVLISSTGVYTALAATEESTTSEYTSALVGSEETETTVPETTVPSTTEPTTSESVTEEATEKETETQVESTTIDVQKPEVIETTTIGSETTTQSENQSTTQSMPKPVTPEDITQSLSNNGEGTGLQPVNPDDPDNLPGSQENPYAINTPDDLLSMNEIINSVGNKNKYFRLIKDIDFENATISSAILNAQGQSGLAGSLVSVNPEAALSSDDVFFHLDGNGKKIKNFTLSSNETSALSVFGYINPSSSIANVRFGETKENDDSASITISSSTAQMYALGIIMKNEGTVSECVFENIKLENTGTDEGTSYFNISGLTVYAGTALVVDNGGIIDGSSSYENEFTALVTGVKVTTSKSYAGTLVAQNRGRINKYRAINFTVTGNSTTSNYVGGLVGANMTDRAESSNGIFYTELFKHNNNGGVTGADKIGYLAGYNTGNIKYSIVTGTVYKENSTTMSATKTDYDLLVYGGKTAGGIVGENNKGDIQNCSAINVGVYFADEGADTIYGGIVGKAITYGVKNCVSTGSTVGDGSAADINRYIGGIIGYGDTDSNFAVEKCYTLVRIIDSKTVLGAVVGFNGDQAYRNGKIKNNYYSSIISSRPSPVSFGGTGESEGDLIFTKPYGITNGNQLQVVGSNFDFEGWRGVTFGAASNLRAEASLDDTYTFNGTTYKPTFGFNTPAFATSIYYDVDITLPSGIGAKSNISAQPMEFRVLNALSPEISGDGTVDSPFKIEVSDIALLSFAPGASFEFYDYWNPTTPKVTLNANTFNFAPLTFWGNVDFGGLEITLDINKPLFKGLYGSRNGSLSNNTLSDHKSSPQEDKDASDSSTNRACGVIENVTVKLGSVTEVSAIFGDICNATVENSNITFTEDKQVVATESNSGLFARTVYGNSYIYGCYIDSYYKTDGTNNNKYKTNGLSGVSAFIGVIDAEKAIIDNCGVDLVLSCTSLTSSKSALFAGYVKSLTGGYIQNCYATGGLEEAGGKFGSSDCNLFAGKIESSSTQIHNCYYSPSFYYNGGTGITSGIRKGTFTGTCELWSFKEGNTSISVKISSANEDTKVPLNNPSNVDRYFIPDFGISVYFYCSIDDPGKLLDGTPSVEYEMQSGTNVAAVKFKFGVESPGSSSDIVVRHIGTGLTAKLKVIQSSTFEEDTTEYHIKTPVDLYTIATSKKESIEDNSEIKLYLDNDVDMSGLAIPAIEDFAGLFESYNTQGQFKLSNLEFSSDSTRSALFANVSGATIQNIIIDNSEISGEAYTSAFVGYVGSGGVTIKNCKVQDSNITGANYVGAFVGGAIDNGSQIIIENCTVINTVIFSKSLPEKSEYAYIGGIAGAIGASENAQSYANIANCIVSGCHISSKAYGIGGVVGYASNAGNTITNCNVTGTTIVCDGKNDLKTVSIGGIAGAFGGSKISNCTVSDGSSIIGECASGIVSRLINDENETRVSDCTVENTTIEFGDIEDSNAKFVGGIIALISSKLNGGEAYGNKVIENCKIEADTTIKGPVAGGIVGDIRNNFSEKTLSILNCTNLGTVETTGERGSSGKECAGGIIGRIERTTDIVNFRIKGCLSNCTLKGETYLGGIIGVLNSATNTLSSESSEKVVQNCYVTAQFSNRSNSVKKGVIAGEIYRSAGTTEVPEETLVKLAENVIYSSLDIRAPLYGNVDSSVRTGGYDMNMGQDQTNGITVDLVTLNNINARQYYGSMLHAIVGYATDGSNQTDLLGKNVITLKPNFNLKNTVDYEDGDKTGSVSYKYNGTARSFTLGTALTATRLPRFQVGNLPEVTGFTAPQTDSFTTTADNTRLVVGSSSTYNKLTDVNIQTFEKKCQADVTTLYTGVVNGVNVSYRVGFTVIVDGDHAYKGSGTKDDPFIIENSEDLLSIKEHRYNPKTNDDYYGNPEFYYEAYYEVVNDIDMQADLLTSNKSFAPIGEKETPFKGHIFSTEGEQYRISNMLIDSDLQYAYSASYGENAKYSDAVGVFGYTEDAEIRDIIFENFAVSLNVSDSTKTESGDNIGINTGTVIGFAKNTTISNVDVIGSLDVQVSGTDFGGNIGSVGGIVGRAETGVVLSDVNLIGDGEGNLISGRYNVGGIVGIAPDSTGCSITNAAVENVSIVNTDKTGTSYAGGIAGQFSGIILGKDIEETVSVPKLDENGNQVYDEYNEPVYEDVIKVTPCPVRVNNVTVSGIVAGGVVGASYTSENSADNYNLSIEKVNVENTIVQVNILDDETIRDELKVVNAVGGIVGISTKKCNCIINNCTVDSASFVKTGYCAGGIVGKAENYMSELKISNCTAMATVEQQKAPQKGNTGVSDSIKRNTGIGSIIGVVNTAVVMDKNGGEALIKATNVTAGGSVSGTYNVGGAIGQFATVQNGVNQELSRLSESFISDCIVAADIKTYNINAETSRFGIVIGAVEDSETPFEESYEYAVRPFDKIYYSSYMTGEYKPYGTAMFQNYQKSSGENFFAGADAFTGTVYDVNKLEYIYERFDNAATVVDYEKDTVIPLVLVSEGNLNNSDGNYQRLNGIDFVFSEDFISYLDNDEDTPFSFTLGGKKFELKDNGALGTGIKSSNEEAFTIVEGNTIPNVTDDYYIKAVSDEVDADLVFEYTNGIRIAVPVLCGVSLEGGSDKSIKVKNAKTFARLIPVLPGYSYIQTADIDFDEETIEVSELSRMIENFTGTYNGDGYKITGFDVSINASANPVGIFGNIKGGTVKNLTLENCTVSSTDTTVGTGLVAGAVTEGGTIENVNVISATVTASTGPVGGAVGTVEGENSTVKNVSVSGTETGKTTVVATTGSAGGLIGTVTTDNVVITNPKVSEATVKSATAYGENIAGGIVAQAVGTIRVEPDESGIIADAVNKVTVSAYISGGAVGAVYSENLVANIDTLLNLENLRITGETKVGSADGSSSAGILGLARRKADVSIKNCSVDKNSVINSKLYSGGVVAELIQTVKSLNIVDTESYATVNANSTNNSDKVYAAGIVAYVGATTNEQFDLNNLKIDGSVAGGIINGSTVGITTGGESNVAGVIGGLNEKITEPVTTSLFQNGVISSTLNSVVAGGSNEGQITQNGSMGKFIAAYNDTVFTEENFINLFSNNYHSSYPQKDVGFFASGSYDNLIDDVDDEDGFMFYDVNKDNLQLSDNQDSNWNSVAFTKDYKIDDPDTVKNEAETTLYAKLDVTEIAFGSEQQKSSKIDGDSFKINPESANPCVELSEEALEIGDTGVFEFSVIPNSYGAEELVVEYDCGLATTATILSVEIDGSGTVEDPFLITNATQLRVVGYLTTGGRYFKQMNDIDLSTSYNEQTEDNKDETDLWINHNDGKCFAPIGSDKAPFDGVYDGQGFRIIDLRINRAGEEYVGLFGKVNGGTIKNIHVELMSYEGKNANGIVGKNYVGGIAGSVANGIIDNCSVTEGSVIGNNYVGGIAGEFSDSNIINCFTQSDVSAFSKGAYSAGIVGYVQSASASVKSLITGSFAAGSIYATTNSGADINSRAAGIVGYVSSANNFEISNCLFTGTTSSGNGILYGDGNRNMIYTISDCIDAGQSVATSTEANASSQDKFQPLSSVVSTVTATETRQYDNVYYDSSLLKVKGYTAPVGVSAKTTSELVGMTYDDSSDWIKMENHYPYPAAYSADGYTSDFGTDKYSQAYAKFLSVPIHTDKKECTDVSDITNYGTGLVYPVTLLTNIKDGEEDVKVTYSSSKFDVTDTNPYPDDFDTMLYGRGADKNVDLLFGDNEEGYTMVYRNIFDTTIGVMTNAKAVDADVVVPTKNTYVRSGAAEGLVFEQNGEAYYNAQVPVVYATATIDGVEVQRDIKIPLSHGTAYCIATQRQLYALGGKEASETPNKFSNYYGSGYDYKLIADIDCTELVDAQGKPIKFKPIGSEKINNEIVGYSGRFDGSGCTIKGLVIESQEDYTGMFAMLRADGTRMATIENLTLENVTVSGTNYVGTLVGVVENANVEISNCHAVGSFGYDINGELDETTIVGKVTGTGSYVGGLIGRLNFTTEEPISKCSSSVTVYGSKDSVGGLIGYSNGEVTDCYATGNVICTGLTSYTTDNNEPRGVGGLIGVMKGGSVKNSFASGNVFVEQFTNNLQNGEFGIGGLVGYVHTIESENNDAVISESFSGGNVSVNSSEKDIAVTSGSTVILGVGGFSGINRASVQNVYSSAVVSTSLENVRTGESVVDSTRFVVGVGGIAGVACAGISNVYSSGSVLPDAESVQDRANSTYSVGGTVGAVEGIDVSGNFELCYFDAWTNTVADLTSIGDNADDGTIKSLSTPELTKGEKPSLEGWPETVWGFTKGAYPYLVALLNEDVDETIKTNAILSVVCVDVALDDVSAKTGNGVTKALTVPTTFNYKVLKDGKTIEFVYTLDWIGANLDPVTHQATITRTQNAGETRDLVAVVNERLENGVPDGIDYSVFATRVYSRACADMRGTLAQPYLIGSVTDLAHVNMTADELEVAKNSHKNFYDQWGTPLDKNGNPVEGTVHYQLMSNIDLDDSGCDVCDGLSALHISGERDFVFDGNGYEIRTSSEDIVIEGAYFNTINDNSILANTIFDIDFAGEKSAIVDTNSGTIQDVYVRGTVINAGSNTAGLVIENNGTIDGCVVDATIKGAESNVGMMAVTNNGIIRDSATAGQISTVDGDKTVSNIGAFVVTNSSQGTITDSFSMADVDVLVNEAKAVQNISGFVAINSGALNGVYTRSSVDFANAPADTNTVAALVGTFSGGTVSNAYSSGQLGYYCYGTDTVAAQDSILFGNVSVGESAISNVYADKAHSGMATVDSFKYSTATADIISMGFMPESMKFNELNNNETTDISGKFTTVEGGNLTYPQNATISLKENDRIVDDSGYVLYVDSDGNIYNSNESGQIIDANGNVIEDTTGFMTKFDGMVKDGLIIRNYDILKAYSVVSTMTVKTSNFQYVDRLIANSNNATIHNGMQFNSDLSSVAGVVWNRKESIVTIQNSRLYTESAGIDVLYAKYQDDIKLLRGAKINPELTIDIEVVDVTENGTLDFEKRQYNPNFKSGIGTSEYPYVIDSAYSLQSLYYYGSDSSLNFVLNSDIKVDKNFMQIPVFNAKLNDVSEDSEYSGTKYAIEGYTSDKGGIFNEVENDAVINNIAIVGANVKSDGLYTGALANTVNGGKITNCVVSADVTSTSTDSSAATGILAGLVNGNAEISGVVTTGEAVAQAGAVGGVIGSAESATMSEFVSTANVGNLTQAGGIIGIMGENAKLTNALYGGIAESGKPIVSNNTANVKKAFYDTQLNKGVDEETAIGEGKTTKECETVFKNTEGFYTFEDGGFYPLPIVISEAVAIDVNHPTSYESYGSTAALAAVTMNFYSGSNMGNVGFYTSMLFTDTASASQITAKEVPAKGYFVCQDNEGTITKSGNVYEVKTNKFHPDQNPAIVLTLENGAKRTIKPGLVRNANITYTITNPSGFEDVTGKTLGVLFKSVSTKANAQSVNVLNEFTQIIGTPQSNIDALTIASEVNGFYVGEMLPAGYEYEIVKVILNGEELQRNNTFTETNVYGTFVNLPIKDNDEDYIETNVELILKIVESDRPWGVNSISNILW